MEKSIVKGGIYQHFKGNLYHVLGFASDSETLEIMVIYRALYGEHKVWVRPLGMFAETIERGGVRKERFAFTGSVSTDGTIEDTVI